MKKGCIYSLLLTVLTGQAVAQTVSVADVEAKPGETVLLSPCCASFDLFKNMEDRGEQFKELVKNL